MNPKEALDVLASAAALAKLNQQEHILVQQATDVIKKVLEKKDESAKPNKTE